ncbi:MAG: hypothetical protein EOP33_01115 [Rickettsiaceae bacterium]|nr:MAG: hypothetical protein EOP33_01115 [Rickettsiaceae bacterium]
MRPIGIPFTSIIQGVGATLFFGSIATSLGYQAYANNDVLEGFVSLVYLSITGLAIHNTVAFAFPENLAQNEDFISVLGGHSQLD